MITKTRISMLLIGAVLASPLAAQEGPYVRLGVGQANIDNKRTLGIDDGDTAFSGAFGYRFTPYLGAELGYVNLGKQQDRVAGGLASVESKGLTIGLSGKYHFDGGDTGWFIDGRAGAMRGRFEGRRLISTPTPGLVAFREKSTWNPYYGLGAGYDFNNSVGLGLSYTRFEVGDRVSADADMAALNFEYRF